MSLDAVKASLEKGKLPHALLFLGPQNAGQFEAARELARILFCRERPPAGRAGKGASACGKCISCRQSDAGNHPDLRVVQPEEDSKSIKIEQVREMKTQANMRPFQADSKVFIIDRAETLNEAAQNALLKTLEEPPPSTYIILISYAAEKMIMTVRSRAQEFRFAEKGVPAEPEAQEEAERAILEYLLGKRGAPDMAGLSREDVLATLEAVLRDLRSALVASVGAAAGNGRPGVAAVSEELPRGVLIDKMEKLAEFKEKVQMNANTKLALAVLWEEL